MVKRLPVVVRMLAVVVQDGTCFKLLQGHSSLGKLLLIRLVKPSRVAADRSARLWNVQGGTCLKTFQGEPMGFVQSALVRMALLPASGSHDALLRLWDWQQETCSKACQDTKLIWAVAFHPNGQMVAAVIKPCGSGMRDGICCRHCLPAQSWTSRQCSDQTVRLWDVHGPASEPYKDIRVGFGQSR